MSASYPCLLYTSGLPIDAKEPLEQAIKSKLNAAGVVDVEMYIRPMDTQPVSIFVTGFVPRPGNYKMCIRDRR